MTDQMLCIEKFKVSLTTQKGARYGKRHFPNYTLHYIHQKQVSN